MSKDIKKKGLLVSVKNENYINILKNENTELDNKLKKVNELVSKLKTKITENEKEKNLLISTSYQKDKDIENIKNQLEKTKSQVDELKKINKNQLSSSSDQNNNLQNNKEINLNILTELQRKITDLEFQLKSSSSIINKKFSILLGAHNFSLAIQGIPKKPIEENFPDILGIKNCENKNFKNELFLTGRNELIEVKENNQKLQENLEALQNEIYKHENDKINMLKELEEYNKEKNNLLNILNIKNEEINGKLNKENELNNNLMKQIIENKKIQNNLDNIRIKYKNLEKNKKELEDVIFQQENKVNELSSSIKKIMNIVKIKNIEINNNKIYINNLEETIKDLKQEFHQIRIKKKKNNSQEISNLRTQLETLKKDYQKLIDFNNNIGANRQLFNYNHISNNHIISRNYNINNYGNYNNNGNNKIKIKMFVNKNQNKRLYSALKISNIVNKNENKRKRVNSQKNIHKNEINYDSNNDILNNNKLYEIENNEANYNHLYHINRKNIKVKKNGNLRYNSNIKNNNKSGNISLFNLNNYKLNDEKIFKNESEEKYYRIPKIKKLNCNDFRHKIIDLKKFDRVDNTVKDRTNKIIFKSSNLLHKQKGITQDDRKEIQKIQEFKNLLDQIVNEIDN